MGREVGRLVGIVVGVYVGRLVGIKRFLVYGATAATVTYVGYAVTPHMLTPWR